MVPWWIRERTFQSKFVCHSPKKPLDNWRCTENRNSWRLRCTTESTLKDNISSFCLLRLIDTEPGKGINFVGTYSFRCGKENVRFKKLLKLVRTLYDFHRCSISARSDAS